MIEGVRTMETEHLFSNEDIQPETAMICQQFAHEVARQYSNQSLS